MSRENSSFAKVYKILFETAECKAVITRIVTALEGISLKEVKWDLRDDSQNKAQVSPQFIIACGQRDLRYSGPSQGGGSHIDVGSVLDSNELGTVASWNEGKISTYNCSWEVIKSGRSYGPRGSQESFRSWAQDKIRGLYKDKFEQAQIRINQIITDHQQTEEFAKSQQDALQGYCVQEVSQVLLRFSHLPAQILREGVQHYMVSEIMDE